MKKKIIYGLCLLIIIGGVITVFVNSYNSNISTFNNKDKSNISILLNTVIQKHIENNKFSGTVLVSKGGKIIFNEGYGYANRFLGKAANTAQTKYLIGSISKTFTAYAILQLADENKLRLDDKVTKYYPEYTGWAEITLHQLLNHTSGIDNYYDTPIEYVKYFYIDRSSDEIISQFKNKPLLFKPGTDYDYSNTNYMILTGIIEKVSKETYSDYLYKNILQPLNIQNTGYETEISSLDNFAKGNSINMFEIPYYNLSNFQGAAGLYSNTEDLLNFCLAMNEEKMLNDISKVKTKNGYYGYGMTFRDMDKLGDVYCHTGCIPGISSGMFKLTNKDMVIIILSNNQQFSTMEMLKDLYTVIENDILIKGGLHNERMV